MKSTVSQMRHRLAALEPQSLDIIDDSDKHAGHAGAQSGGGHFRLSIVSRRFEECGTMARHRLVYDALGSLMQREIHALSIIAKTPAESQT